MSLNRRFTPFGLLLLSINGMVGSAWLFAPLYAAKIAGPGAIIAWILGGLITVTIALTFAELSVMMPVAGGTAQIPKLSHGIFTSFMMGWIAWLSALTMAPIEVQAILQYASTYFTSLMNIKNGVPILSVWGYLWATTLMLSFCILNVISFQALSRSNFAIFTFKILVIILAIVAIISTSLQVMPFESFSTIVTTITGWQAILTALATGGVAFAFTGFKHGVELAGEVKNAAFTIPFAIIGSIVCCLILYIGLQVAFIGALRPDMLAQGWQALSFSGDVGPFAGLALGLGLTWLVKLLYIDATVSPAGAGLIYVTSTARILYAMSKIGYLPKWLAHLNKQKFPVAAIGTNFVIGMFLFLPFPGWQAMVSFLVSGMVISYAAGPIALLSLRRELPNYPRSFQLPAAYLMCNLAFYFCNLLSYWTGWETIYKLAIAMLIGFSFFTIAVLKGRLASQDIGLKKGLWIVLYLAGLVSISYLGAFGGRNIIPFGWDFLIIGLFSFGILHLALFNRASLTEASLKLFIAD